jgi:2'-phosphotransferase
MNNKQLITISKSMSYLIRHGASKEKVKYNNEGYFKMSDVLDWLNKNNDNKVSIEQIYQIVNEDKKGRYTIIKDDKQEMIRANQGHSFDVSVNMTKITLDNIDDYGIVLHGTYEKYYDSIVKNGLSKMSRLHIHMVSLSKPEPFKMMRNTIDMFVSVNIKKALEDGIQFMMSANNVILSSGNSNGNIPAKYLTFLSREKSPGCGVIVIGYDQYKKPHIAMVKTSKNYWSYPKGKKENNEMSLDTALRELEEETSIKHSEISFISAPCLLENNDNNNNAYCYYFAFLKDLYIEAKPLKQSDTDELIDVRWIPLNTLVNWKDNEEDGYLRQRRIDIAKHTYNNLINI